MREMQRRIKIGFIAMALTIALLSSALGLIWLQQSIDNQMHIQAVGAFSMTLEDGVTPVTAIAWGTFYPGDSKNSLDILGSTIVIHVTGSKALKFMWTATGLNRTAWGITATWNLSPNPFPEDTYAFSIAPPGTNGWMAFQLTSIDLTNTVERDDGFSIVITATEA
jgi:hypothetical protein